jgi:CubicO group peptidase (beta-lactamase class C family)
MDQPIADILDEELIRPFGLTSMSTVTTEQWGGYGGLGVRPFELAQGYTWVSGQSQEVEYENTTWKVLGGGLQTNVLDLARFGALTLSGAIVSNTARLWTDLTAGGSSWDSSESPITSTGLGWRVSDRGPELSPGVDRAAADHGGDAPGAGTLIRIYRDGDLVIAIMGNQQESSILLKTDGTPAGHPVESLATRLAGAVFRP